MIVFVSLPHSMFVTDMTFSEIFLFHYGWQGAALAVVLLLLLCIQLRYHLLAYGRIPAYRNNRRQTILDSEPPLSVIVPMFAEDYLFIEERLPLLLAQEYSEFEIVLVYIGRDGDFFEDLQRIHQSIPRVTATKIEQMLDAVAARAAAAVRREAAKTARSAGEAVHCSAARAWAKAGGEAPASRSPRC